MCGNNISELWDPLCCLLRSTEAVLPIAEGWGEGNEIGRCRWDARTWRERDTSIFQMRCSSGAQRVESKCGKVQRSKDLMSSWHRCQVLTENIRVSLIGWSQISAVFSQRPICLDVNWSWNSERWDEDQQRTGGMTEGGLSRIFNPLYYCPSPASRSAPSYSDLLSPLPFLSLEREAVASLTRLPILFYLTVVQPVWSHWDEKSLMSHKETFLGSVKREDEGIGSYRICLWVCHFRSKNV